MLSCCCVAGENKSDEVTIKKTPFGIQDEDGGATTMLTENALQPEEPADEPIGFKEVLTEADSRSVMKKIEEEPEVSEPPEPTKVVVESPFEFVVNVRKDGAKLGFAVETLFADYCVARRVEPSSPLKNVKPYDRLVKVNGASAKASQLAKMVTESDQLELMFQRPAMKEIVLEKAGQKAGFRIEKTTPGAATMGLVIKGLEGGAASEMPSGTFKSMDRICAINGQEGTAGELLEMLAQDRVVLTLCSYSDVPE